MSVRSIEKGALHKGVTGQRPRLGLLALAAVESTADHTKDSVVISMLRRFLLSIGKRDAKSYSNDT